MARGGIVVGLDLGTAKFSAVIERGGHDFARLLPGSSGVFFEDIGGPYTRCAHHERCAQCFVNRAHFRCHGQANAILVDDIGQEIKPYAEFSEVVTCLLVTT